MKRIGKTREAWLDEAIRELKQGLFKRSSYTIPHVTVSVGFPYASRSSKAIGQHWHRSASSNKKGTIFISPVIGESVEALAVLVHELVHEVVGSEAGHGPIFRKCAIAVGLEGKMRATVASAALKIELAAIVKKIGTYPHSKLDTGLLGRKKQTTRMIKMECEECGYIARASRKFILVKGGLICPCNFKEMIVHGEIEELEEESA